MPSIYKSFTGKICCFTSVIGLSLGLASVAHAATVGFTLNLSGNNNVPTLVLTNNSTSALLTDFSLTIGDTSKNFDSVDDTVAPLGGSFVSSVPDANDGGGSRADTIEIEFSGFDPTEFAQWTSDVDKDTANTIQNYEIVLFNNGALANSVATATFGDGTILALTLDDRDVALTSHSFTAASVVPIPAAAWLFGSALLGLGVIKRKKA